MKPYEILDAVNAARAVSRQADPLVYLFVPTTRAARTATLPGYDVEGVIQIPALSHVSGGKALVAFRASELLAALEGHADDPD